MAMNQSFIINWMLFYNIDRKYPTIIIPARSEILLLLLQFGRVYSWDDCLADVMHRTSENILLH